MASPACAAISARRAWIKSPRSPTSVLKTKKLGRLIRNVTSSNSGTFSAE